MPDAFSLHFESKLRVPAQYVWEWIISVKGISAEMRPFLRMTFPKGIRSLDDLPISPGVRMFRSYVFLFGFLPIDYSDMTFLKFNVRHGFIEQSPMGSMKLWRHERCIVPSSEDTSAVLLIDNLTFSPRIAKRLVRWFIRRVFIHRHKVIRKNLGMI